jgi:hypothetical protein
MSALSIWLVAAGIGCGAGRTPSALVVPGTVAAASAAEPITLWARTVLRDAGIPAFLRF